MLLLQVDRAVMTRLCWLFVLGTLVVRVSAADSLPPFGMSWSNKTFGPDGPWQAVQIGVGYPIQQVALYPGGTFRSHFLTPRICSNTTLSPTACFASAGGLYASESSNTALDDIIGFPAATDFTHGGLRIEGTAGIGALDQMVLGTSDLTRKTITVPNVTIAMYDSIAAIYPSGSIAALQVGTLGLGYLGTVNQSFTFPDEPLINGSLIPGYLQAANLAPSNSFGLQIGSVKSKIKGSLYFGGYDQSRICGTVSTQQGAFAGIEPDDDGTKGLIDLLDIAINVVDGSSPFNTSAISNLLATGNSSIGSALSVPMLPEAPYLNLPKSSCDAIAAWLPVTYNTDLGLYTWNTDDPRYTQIVSSPSVLGFIFRKDQSNSQNITINVPFTLLNLTLEAPLVTSTVPYFPCNAQSNGKYSLGRAFLQAAFVGANWNANNNQGVWWLAQAPGPNIGSQTSVQTIKDQDATISPSSNDWVASWKSVLVPLTVDSAGTATTNSTATNTTSSSDTEKPTSRLTTGAKAGIGAGIAVLVLGIIAFGVFIFLYLRKKKSHSKGDSTPEKYSDVGYVPAELNTHEQAAELNSASKPAELNSQAPLKGHLVQDGQPQPVYELGGDVYR
ncbi:Acid protease [Glarea lozoyensis ATCC 20868]|uniref:Acid protease n=1 Tax=Glarea lozoyensis (strain ATCC 20868 / MF5171) TaxID=1116229 RepID=S3DYB3_GLAL2|nr:Acid protease [Glarea lozoyensis ATCC 20868]EPE36916.1 Acid protease [Glarea lozoyensis ATCC 20868]